MLLISAFNIPVWYLQEEKVDTNIEKTFLTLAMSLGFFMTAFGVISAPYIGKFYNNEEMVLPFQILSFIFIFHGYYLFPITQLRRELQFKTIGFINLWSGVTRVILVYILALLDFGYWSLVIGTLFVEFAKNYIFFICERFASWIWVGIRKLCKKCLNSEKRLQALKFYLFIIFYNG